MWQLRFWTYILLLALSLAPVQRVVACSCLRVHPQEIFCSSNFVVLAKVNKVEDSDMYKVAYHLKIRKIFTAAYQELLIFVNTKVVETSFYSSMCGVQLRVGGTYILSARATEKGVLQINMCSMPREWRTLGRNLRKLYLKSYKSICSCGVQSTSWLTKGNALDNTGGKKCLWEGHPGPERCQEDFGVCMPVAGRCSWYHTVEYKKCIKGHQQQHQRRPRITV